MLETIRLFKAVPVENKDLTPTPEINRKTIEKYGFIFGPGVVASYPKIDDLIKSVNDVYGRNAEELNNSFHKSFAKVRDASIEQLVFEQMTHYLTTYWAEFVGAYHPDSVYIPVEEFDVPELKDIRLVVIRGLTKEELKNELLTLLSSGVALHKRTLNDAMAVARFVDLSAKDLESVKNYEARARLHEIFGSVPESPVEFLRFVVYKLTGSSLLIKNSSTVEALKAAAEDALPLFEAYDRFYGYDRLSQIFLRYKPLFLALRTGGMRPVVNRLRKLANVNHRPMKEDYLSNVTARLSRAEPIGFAEFSDNVGAESNVFRKIRLAYAINYRMNNPESIMYRVRNGKSYAKEFSLNYDWKTSEGFASYADKYLSIVRESIVEDVSYGLSGKKIYIPDGVRYALPATEKQFTGNLPSGSYAEVKEDMVFGVYWKNQDGQRVDLDLSLLNADAKIGWDGAYRQNSIYFTGDVTDAPHGASELFHVGADARGVWSLNVNHYNRYDDLDVPFKIVVSQDIRRNLNKNYVIDPSRIIVQSNSVMDIRQKNLGIVVADDDSTRFYFAESNLGTGITAKNTDYAEHARRYLVDYYKNALSLNDVLIAAGAELVDSLEEAEINLSPEATDKTTFIKLITGTN